MVGVNPMLATAVTELPSGEGWAFEFKWDGVRALLDVSEQGVTIRSRAGNEVTAAYPELATLAGKVGDALLDGEIVAFVDGQPSFERLQTRMHVRSAAEARRLAADTPVTFMAFDLLRRYGVDLSGRPYAERRATLERWGAERPDWTISPMFDDGAATTAAAREHGLEGVVAKRLGAPYRAGARSPDWRKLRFVRAGDFVVVGWEASGDRPGELSSLVLGYHPAGGMMTYAGKVGSGYTGESLADLATRLAPLRSEKSPFADAPRMNGATWVKPRLVAQIAFAEWTAGDKLRQPVFLGLRRDKSPRECRWAERER